QRSTNNQALNCLRVNPRYLDVGISLVLGCWSFRAKARLLLRFRRRFAGFLGKRLDPLEFRLETAHEIVSAVFEKNDETKGEKDEEDEPEKPAKQRHETMVTYSLSQVNGLAGARAKFRFEPRGEAAILSEPCGCLCSISASNMQPWRSRFALKSKKCSRPRTLFSGPRSRPLRRR